MATVQDDIVIPALREIGVLAASETGTPGEQADAFAALNRLVDQMTAERLQIQTIIRVGWSLVPSQNAYQVGPTSSTSGLAITPRPVTISHVGFIDLSPTTPVEIQLEPLTDDGFANFQKGLFSTVPRYYYYQPAAVVGSPNSFLWLLPVPTVLTAANGMLYYPAAISEFASLATVISLPAGYRQMLVKNLALQLIPSYPGTQINPLLVKQAQDSIAIVKRSNVRLMDMSFGADALIGSYGRSDIRTGP